MKKGFIWFLIFLASCASMGQKNEPDRAGIVQMKTNFYDSEGKPTFTDILKIWYRDSVAVEEIHRINRVTDTANITTIHYTVILYRYIDLRSKTLYDYKSFSDTAKIFNKAVLPDSLMVDYGWSFYSEKGRRIQGVPEVMNDTLIDNMTYKKAKFHFMFDDPEKSFRIGYFKCDGKGGLFSLEKSYSRNINCSMTKFSEFKVGKTKPFATIELEFLSDTLTDEELRVFDTWEKNAKQNPVSR